MFMIRIVKFLGIFVVDNTFMTPYFQKPLTFGADVVMHSIGKYINGHCDVMMGVALTNSEEFHKRIRFFQEGKRDVLLIRKSITICHRNGLRSQWEAEFRRRSIAT